MKHFLLLFLAVVPMLFMAGEAMAAKGGKATLKFESFDGGGPTYKVVLHSDIVAYVQERAYAKPNHGELDGAGFTIAFTFTGLKPGETTMTVEERSSLGENLDRLYSVKVDSGLNVEIRSLTVNNLNMAAKPMPTLVIKANGKVFYASLEQNASARAFARKLSSQALTVQMHDYGNFEKVGPLPWSLVRSDKEITTEPGDIILYQGNKITIYYDKNSWNFTRLAKIENTSRKKLLEAFGSGSVTVEFWVEWSE